MARLGVDYESIKQAAVKLLSQGMAPSVQKIREVLGTGSNTTIAEHLKVWREEYAQRIVHHLPASMPKELISTFEALWQTAMEHAQNELAEYKLSLESKHEEIMQMRRDSEKFVSDIKQKLVETSIKLENEVTEKQNISIEFAVINDRLEKQREAFSIQKNQYEDRLRCVYEDKDNVTTQCSKLQSEIKILQRKLETQTEQHQNLLAKQNILHEQSENRWVNLIDGAKQDAKESQKKLENLRINNEENIKKLNVVISDMQIDLHDKHAMLKGNLEKISQLKQEIESLKTENTNLNTAITNSKNAASSIKTKFKKGKLITPQPA